MNKPYSFSVQLAANVTVTADSAENARRKLGVLEGLALRWSNDPAADFALQLFARTALEPETSLAVQRFEIRRAVDS